MEGKGGSHRETLTSVRLPSWMRSSNLSAQCCICARKGPRTDGPRLQLLQAQRQKNELPKPSCCYIFWRQIDCPEQCPWWPCHGVHLRSASLPLAAHTHLTSCLRPSFGFACTLGGGSLSALCVLNGIMVKQKLQGEQKSGCTPQPPPYPEFWRSWVHHCGWG